MKKMADIMSKTGKWLLVFGFILSQLSFPLEILAEELNDAESTNTVVEETTDVDMTNTTEGITPDDDIQTEEVVIKVNGVETLEYTTTEENTFITISLEYQDETKNKVESIEFSEKLYGIYEYTFEGIDKVVTINHIGNNIDLVEKVSVDVTKEIICTLEECIIKGFGSDVVTVEDINSYFDFVNFNTMYNATTSITNEGQALIDTETTILNGYNLEIVGEIEESLINGKLENTTPKSIYTLNRVGDVFIPSDGIVNEKDQEAILDDILLDNELTVTNDLNSDGKLNILDATHSTFIDNIEVEVTDILTNTLTSSSDEILLGETVEVKLFISGFDKAMLRGIEGKLVYDKNILELVGAAIYEPTTDIEESTYLGYINEGKFAYILKNGFNLEGTAILTLEFEAIAIGETDITISDIIESYGEEFELVNDNASVNLTVADPEDNKGGDVEEEQPKEDTTKEEETENKEETEVVTKPVVRPVALSSDYYLRNLTIEGYDIDFNMYTYEYSIKVASDVNSLNIKALLNDSNSIYYIEGNENFKEGENLVYVIVKAENGSTKTYTIKVEKEKAKEIVKDNNEEGNELDEDVEKEEKNSSKTVIIILIILVIIGLIYVIFKDDEEDTKGTKKTTKSEKNDKVRIEEVKSEKVSTQKKNTTKRTNSNTKKNTKKK